MKTLNEPGVCEKMQTRGAEPGGSTPEQFTACLRNDITPRWTKLARSTNIKVD